ncbi:MAG: DUF1592 domain-containing protein [Planctomycetota bacterium]|nr:DUF1592 domain-containing protein [Planctomycetota bacterium]
MSLVSASLLVLAVFGTAAGDETVNFADLQKDYSERILPGLKQFCLDCHSTEKEEGELDLQRFATLADVRRDPKTWQKVAEMLDNGEMPPEDSEQPSVAQRKQLRAWVESYLNAEALASAGDPGPIVLRRLSNAEYTYTIQDLTGADSLDPTSEFPVDGAAGEGFTNTGSAQGMSPSLVQKYLDAAKAIAEHAVLLPEGIRFSPATSRRDHTDQLLARIQGFYRNFTEDGGGSAVNLQGIQFDTNQGGVLGVEKYLAATLQERESLRAGSKTIEQVASERGLNARYLATLWKELSAPRTAFGAPWSPLTAFRQRWQVAKADDAPQLAAVIDEAQKRLWKFNSIGQYGREGGAKRWMEAVSPLVTKQEFRLKVPKVESTEPELVESQKGADGKPTFFEYDFTTSDVRFSAYDLGDGNEQDFVVLHRPRFEFSPDADGAVPPPILLRDANDIASAVRYLQISQLPRTALYLAAVAKLHSVAEQDPDAPQPSLEEIAKADKLNPPLLAAWVKYVGLSQRASREITGHFTNKMIRGQGYDAINGWGLPETPSLLTNSSNEPITFLTLTVPARGVTVHPSPTLESIVAWQSPLDATMRIDGLVADADDKCGNGAAWRLELRSESGTSVLAEGVFDSGKSNTIQLETPLAIRTGDVVALIVNACDGNHSCDTTHVELKLSQVDGDKRVWDLATDVVDKVLDSNPLPDSFGNEAVWHFCASANGGDKSNPAAAIPPGSSLANWRAAVVEGKPAEELQRLALAVQQTVPAATAERAKQFTPVEISLRQQVRDFRGPINWLAIGRRIFEDKPARKDDDGPFGKHPNGSQIDPADLCEQAVAAHLRIWGVINELIAGAEFVVEAELHPAAGREGSVLLTVEVSNETSRRFHPIAGPILAGTDEAVRKSLEKTFAEFRDLFPPALCYARIVPVDEVVTLTLFYREDDHLRRLMLDDEQAAELDRLWDELYYVSQEPLQLVVALEQITQFATQDRQDLVPQFEALKQPIGDRAEKFRQRLVDTEPAHLNALLEFADRAWRRRLSDAERQSLRDLYQTLREAEIPHQEAIRLTLARVLASPAFLYRREQPAPANSAALVTDIELASRLSYFLWSSAPDDELRRAASAGDLRNDDAILSQTRRMLADPRTRRLAIQFACQWLHVRNFDQDAEKNEKLYPEFAELRDDMYEETVRFFEDMFRNDGSILSMLDADHTFLNGALAKCYGIDGVSGSQWQRVDGIRSHGRGGILAMATVLASQSGASRTSPILRGNWVYETLLGQRLPRPPAGVPVLPDEPPQGLTARALIEQHSSVEACAKCHLKIDPYGFALEQFDAIGRLRPAAVDTTTTLAEGQVIDGIDGLRNYLLNERRDDVVRHFCRKLLGYSLGREVQLSDKPLLDRMMSDLEKNDYRFRVAIESIVFSDQFRKIRGTE